MAARLNFLAQDRTDQQYAVKEVSRFMPAPRTQDWDCLRRAGLYLLYKPRATIFYKWQGEQFELTVYSDTHWAGCRTTRRSTSGGMVLRGSHLIRSWPRQQHLVSLSSAEAELYGFVKASSEALGIKSMAKDFG